MASFLVQQILLVLTEHDPAGLGDASDYSDEAHRAACDLADAGSLNPANVAVVLHRVCWASFDSSAGEPDDYRAAAQQLYAMMTKARAPGGPDDTVAA